jgi:PAS domain S-box-containing protein
MSKRDMVMKNPVISRDFNGVIVPKNEEELLKIFIKRVPTAVAVLNTDLRFLIASDRFFQETGLSEDELLSGRHWYDLVPDMPRKWKIIHFRTLNGEHLKCDEDVFYRQDGTIEWWRWETLPWFDEMGHIGGMILNVENITKQKQTEKNLKQMVKSLNENNRALARFAHICAHDLNEPLRTITNYVQLIERYTTGAELDPSLKDYLRTVIENARYMHTLVQNLLDYSQMRVRKIKPENFELTTVVQQVLKALGRTIEEKNAEITYDPLPQIYGDEVLITQVIQNLIHNALKFNDKEKPSIQIKVKDCHHFWLFSVNDNGIGIDNKYLNKIFVEFMRLHPKSVYNGSGIGLSQCKKIIEDHNGRIWARSIPQEGTTFYFTLPKHLHS